ncbi:Ig-like domain-containing protein [Ezakiella coagulans]|uniref:Ig-like domain-containing protein n=1 Tax=Ezakiella coagulans TaxID=46507 RepID=UPI0020149D88|nr:Ig-like domain-containing protein [Ezakiella coagulans]UQK60025.1 Ig-like domain-containing protein [Ezakiella coagulans]
MKNRKLLASFIVFFMTIALFVPAVSEAYGYRRTYAPRLGEARQNEEFIRWQNQQNYGNFGATGEEDYEGLVPEPAKIYFGRPRAQRFERLGFPATYDLRDHNKVSEIRDQGPNGSCWTFACYSSLESTLRPGEILDFSEKHMRNTHGFDWGPEKGGNRFISTAYLARWSGPILEEEDPYSPYDFVSPKNLVRAKDIKEVMYLPDMDVDFDEGMNAIKDAIMNYGAVQTAMYASDRYLNKAEWAHYCPRRVNGNHAVAIIGWDDNYPKENFRQTPPKNGAWLIRNSWGKDMGIDGYYWASYYDTVVGTNNAVYFAKDKGESDYIYQYDPYGMTRTVGYNGKGYGANIFGPVKEKQYVNGAGFYVPAANTDYKVYVVKDYKGLDSLKNDRVEVASGTVEYPGYTTVTFDKQEVQKDSKFAVVVYYTTLETYYPIPIEARERKYASRVNAYPGQSYTSSDGAEWRDLTVYNSSANVCIKGFTTLDGEGTPDEPKPDEPKEVKKVTGIKLSQNKAQLNKWNRLNLKYTITPADADNKEVVWTSSDPSVARVDNYGSVLALKDGVATITVKTKDGGFTDSCEVTVGNGGVPQTVKVTYVDITNNSLFLNAGETTQLNVVVKPENATNKKVEYSTTNANVATVDANGLVKAVGEGRAYIYAKSADGPSDSVYVYVRKSVTPQPPKEVKVTNVSVDRRYLTLEEGENYTLTATVSPADATNKTVNYSSSDSRVATVDANGNIKAVKAGYAYIYAKSVDGPYAYSYVTVKAKETPQPPAEVKVTNITLDTRYLRLDAGKKYELNYTVYPYNATDKTLTWTSSNENVATVENGVITAIGRGSAYITATSSNGVQTSCYVDVYGEAKPVKVTGLYFSDRQLGLKVGETKAASVLFTPNNATNKSVTYSSLNSSIARVDENGNITGVRPGTVYIYARSVDGPYAYLQVTVRSAYNYWYYRY